MPATPQTYDAPDLDEAGDLTLLEEAYQEIRELKRRNRELRKENRRLKRERGHRP